MKLVPTKDDPDKVLFARYISEDGDFECGIHRVLYGWRVRAGRVDSQTIDLDWCCAADPMLVSFTQALMMKFIERGVYKRLPGFSAIKPWVLDNDFVHKLQVLVDELKIEVNLSLTQNIFKQRYNEQRGRNPTEEVQA